MTKKSVNSIDSLLHRGVLEAIDANHLKQRLTSGDRLRIKLGIDPTTPHLHIGHAVPLRKLRQFQDHGHTAVLIIGDYTAQIGDPTGKSEARTMLTAEEVEHNANTYLQQAYMILDKTKTEVRHQSEWFGSFSLRDVIELMAKVTVGHVLAHETFADRLKSNTPLHMHELLYPLMQGYDSVMVKADVELGGIDQKFNVLMGRVIQRAYNQSEQDVMLFPYLAGIDGRDKMSKSLGNTVNLTDSPDDMFGKIMSIPDNLILPYFVLATDLDQEQIEHKQRVLADHSANPKDSKLDLAQTIVEQYYGAQLARSAKENFEKQFTHKQVPDSVETVMLKPDNYDLINVLVDRTTLISSKSEFRRLVEQRGIKKNGRVVEAHHEGVSPTDGNEVLIQIGSRRFLKIVWKSS